jgi:putative DNA primase/helicase
MIALRNVAASLGGDVVGRSVLCPGPGHSPRDRSLSVTLSADAVDGFVVFSHAGDDWRTCRDHVVARLGGVAYTPKIVRAAEAIKANPDKSDRAIAEEIGASPTTVGKARTQVSTSGHLDKRTGRDGKAYQASQPTKPAPRRGKDAARADYGAAAVNLWNAGIDPRGTLAERYLASRSLELADDVAGRVLRFHGACPWRLDDGEIERRPVMLTAFRSIGSDKVVAVHRTLLSDDGRKLDRRMLGPVAGAAIKIDDATDIEYGLTVCEGFETGLAGRALGFRPVWALGSAGAIAEFPVLPGIDALTILAETDDSGANARALRACGNRWSAAGREIIVVTPRVGGDMNDAVCA